MGRPELGTKCTCTGCSERFYDLNRAPAICPKCGVQQTPQKARAPWPTRGAAGLRRPHRPAEPVPADDEDTTPMTAVEDEEDEAVLDSEDDDTEIVIDSDHDAAPD
jgi:uncharacterized protein (TIGR02300 family)